MSYGRPPPRIEGMVSLKVDNLTYRTTSDDLKRVFERCGEVGDIYIPRDRFTRESRGFAFVRFYDKRDAEDALDAMDGRILDGRELRVQMARYGRPTSPRNRYRGGHVPDRHAEEEAAKDVPHPGAVAALTARAVVAGPGPHPGRMDAPDPDHKHRLV
nr:unnamed protein product [Callosobruchus analis]